MGAGRKSADMRAGRWTQIYARRKDRRLAKGVASASETSTPSTSSKPLLRTSDVPCFTTTKRVQEKRD
jgi:hypothetical protein